MAACTVHAYRLFALFIFLIAVLPTSEAQQPYVNNYQLDCYNRTFDNITHGYTCNGPSSCRSYVTFRSNPPYNTAFSIGQLLNASAADILVTNNLSSTTAEIPNNRLIVVPINCSCSSAVTGFYQHNATHSLSVTSNGELETYFFLANNTYQALSTCQALMSQNRADSRHLRDGSEILVPIRCACPTANQRADGFRYLLTYSVAQGDSISYIAGMFRSPETAVREANELSSDLIFYFTPLLVPLRTEFTGINLPPPSPPVSPPPQSPPVSPPVDDTESSHLWVFVGIGIGSGLLLLVSISATAFYFFRKNRTQPQQPSLLPESATKSSVPKTQESRSWSADLSSQENLSLKSAIESLTVYRFQDLQAATSNFSEANRIKGSVYHASINGDNAAVKVIKGDVSSSEISLLKKINHSNIIRLSGFCIREGNSYLVYEYAGMGSLNNWIHSNSKPKTILTWIQRVQICRDIADALNYLHNYINPPHVHKNLKSSNILLDSNLRAKISNFGLARILNKENQDNGVVNLQLTRHVVGTRGYLSPEYVENGVITPKLDVFAFGVIILELLSGREPATTTQKNKERDSNDDEQEEDEMLWVTISRVLAGENVREKLLDFMDPCLEKNYPMELAYAMADLASSCVAQDLNERPSISEVLSTILMIMSSSMEWEPSDELQRSTFVNDSG